MTTDAQLAPTDLQERPPMTNPTTHGQVPAIQRYSIGYHADEWGQRSSIPSGILDASGSWVRYADHVTALAAQQAPAQAAPAQAGEYPALVCDYCGALTPDPWHSSGMLHGKMSKHIHSCDACCRGAAQAAPEPDGDFWPVDENASRKQLIAQIGQMNFRLSALRQENAGLIKRVAGQAEALQNYQRSHEPAPQQEAQEPVAVVVPCYTPSGKRVALYSAKQDLPIGTQLYTAPQHSPAARGDALDAARYRWLAASCRSTSEHWGGRWSIIIDGPAPKSHDSEDDFDAAIDAARARLGVKA